MLVLMQSRTYFMKDLTSSKAFQSYVLKKKQQGKNM